MMKRLLFLLLLPLSVFAAPGVLKVISTDGRTTNYVGTVVWRGTVAYTTNGGTLTATFWDPLTLNVALSNRIFNGGSLIFSNSATLDMGSNRIINVSDPTNASDPVTLGYYIARTNDTGGTDVFGAGIETNVTLPAWATATNFGTLVITSNVFLRIKTDMGVALINNSSNRLSMSAAITMNGATNRSISSNVLSTDDKDVTLTKTVNVIVGSNYTISAIGWTASTTNNGDVLERLNYIRWSGIR